VIILQNDYSLELFNGDVGICVVREDKISVIFENGREFIPEVLPEHRLAYAITIHKSQGSEYQQVSIVLPELNQDAAGDNLLTRELIYTAVTRAKESVTLFSHEDTIFRAIARQTSRNSGLSYLLRKVLQ
jgi:exodeoxyribonuclease V alpha subunit